MLDTNRGFLVSALLCIVTGGLYYYYLVYKFAEETNLACAGDGQKTTGLLMYIIFSIITLGIYPLVWGYGWINRCNALLANNGVAAPLTSTNFILGCLLGAFTLGIWPLINFSKMLDMQNKVNAIYNAAHA